MLTPTVLVNNLAEELDECPPNEGYHLHIVSVTWSSRLSAIQGLIAVSAVQ